MGCVIWIANMRHVKLLSGVCLVAARPMNTMCLSVKEAKIRGLVLPIDGIESERHLLPAWLQSNHKECFDNGGQHLFRCASWEDNGLM